MARHVMAGQGRQGEVWQGSARPGLARQGRLGWAGQGTVWSVRAGRGMAWWGRRGRACPVVVWRGRVRRGLAGEAGHGKARPVKAWRGRAGEVRLLRARWKVRDRDRLDCHCRTSCTWSGSAPGRCRSKSFNLSSSLHISRFCVFWMINTIQNVTIVVNVFMKSCQVSDQPKNGPARNHTTHIATDDRNAHDAPMASAVTRANLSNHACTA